MVSVLAATGVVLAGHAAEASPALGHSLVGVGSNVDLIEEVEEKLKELLNKGK